MASLIAEIDAALKHLIHEIIYVDDGSSDETFSRLKQLQNQYAQFRVIRHEKSCGQSTAIRTGVKAAKYDWVAYSH